MDEKLLEVLEAFLVKTLNLTDSKALHQLVKTDDGELKPNALDGLLEKDVARVTALKESVSGKTQELFDNGYKKGVKEAMQNHEKAVKEAYGIDSSSQGIDLIREIVDANSKVGDLKDEDIKKSKVFLDAMDAEKKLREDAIKDWETKFNDLEGSIKSKETFSHISRSANSIIDSLGLKLSEDPSKAAKQKDVIINMLKGNSYDIQGERIVMLDKDGNRLEDAHGNLIPFEDRVKEIATSIYDVDSTKKKEGSGNKKDDTTPPSNYKFASENDYIEQIKKAETLEQKAEITEAWRNQNSEN